MLINSETLTILPYLHGPYILSALINLGFSSDNIRLITVMGFLQAQD